MTRDLMYTDEVHELVRDAYRVLEAPRGPASRFYEADQLELVPPPARGWALGVGNPIAHAGLRPGESVVDLGCGAGVDVLLAACEVGVGGRVIGVDFLPEMIERARAFAAEGGFSNVSFVHAQMEALPIGDGVADVVVSNGSINLAARKSRVLAEAHRVLRDGGRLCVSDLTLTDEDLPPEIVTHPSAWAG